MPANLTPEYQRAERAYREATTVQEKVAALEQMLSTIPKHKGTEKLQADIKRRLSKARQQEGAAGRGKHFDPYHIERVGAGQVVLIGLPNVGKSAIVGSVSNAKVNVADYPYATHAPVPGMANFEDVQIQLVDMPPFSQEGFPAGMVGAIRSADVIVLVVDASGDDVLEQVEMGLNLLASRQIVPAGQDKHETQTGEDDQQQVFWAMPMLVLCNKVDLLEDRAALEALPQLYEDRLEFLPVSAASGENLDGLVRRLFELLDVVRVYAKPPGKKPDMDQPFVLKRGSTVMDLACSVHRDLPQQVRYARIWGSDKFAGQQVQRDYVLQDKDIIELHTR